MRPLLTAAEARAMDRHAIDALAMSSLVLMENAGRGAADLLRERFAGALGDVLLIGGRGQNGGDAWVVARHLALAGIPTTSILVSDGREPTGDAAINLATLRAMGLPFQIVRDPGALDPWLRRASAIVDGLFGTGLARPIDEPFASVIRAMNDAGAPILALDLPSGIDADTGAVLGAAIRARATATFGHAKRGLLQAPGVQHAGEVRVLGIGAPLPGPAHAELLERADLAALPRRASDAHKGSAGHVLVVGGSAGTTGAALLAARGAARAGAGLVTIAVRPEARAAFEARVLETMTRSFETTDELLALAEGKRALVIGPGLGVDEGSRALVRALVAEAPVPLVLDADALTILAELGLDGLAARAVLTPHPGEAARLLGVRTAEVQADRHAAAQALAARSGQVVVLKGQGSIVAAPGTPARVCPHGTPAMGTGGSGDVLAGVVAATLGDQPPLDVALAVLWHALAGEAAALADRGVLASEIADALPGVLAAVRAHVHATA